MKPAFYDRVNGMAQRIAALDSRNAARPQTPEAFKFELSPNFKPPQGIEFKLNPADPMVAQYRTWAHKVGLDQTQFSEGLDLIAALRVGEHQEFEAAKAAEKTKLGPAADTRITAVVQWLTATAGDKAEAMVRVLQAAPMASSVEAFESIMQKVTTQGAAPFNASGRSAQDNANSGQTIPGYEKMTFEQKRFAQDQARARQNSGAR